MTGKSPTVSATRLVVGEISSIALNDRVLCFWGYKKAFGDVNFDIHLECVTPKVLVQLLRVGGDLLFLERCNLLLLTIWI